MARSSNPRRVRGILIGLLVLLVVAGSVFTGLWLKSRSSSANTSMGTPTDPHIKFVGRWDTSNPTLYHSAWAGAYLDTAFTGTTVKIRLGGFSAVYVSID